MSNVVNEICHAWSKIYIIYINTALLLFESSGTNPGEISIRIWHFHSIKCTWKCFLFSSGPNVLKRRYNLSQNSVSIWCMDYGLGLSVYFLMGPLLWCTTGLNYTRCPQNWQPNPRWSESEGLCSMCGRTVSLNHCQPYCINQCQGSAVTQLNF